MAISGVSTRTLAQSLRTALVRSQNEMNNAQKEATTGRLADPGLKLGSLTSQTVTLNREMERLNNIIDTNALAGSRLSATQNSLKDLTTQAQTFLSTLIAGSSGDATPAVMLASGKSALSSMGSILNASFNGEQIFSGINTDVKPFKGFEDGSDAKTAFDTAFQSYFGFTQTDPGAANISKTDMEGFLASVEPDFLGAGWDANWSNATDATIQSRIALNETASTSVSANIDPVKKLAMAAALTADLYSGNVSEGAREAVNARARALVSEAVAGIANLQASVGVTENRITATSERLKMQADVMELHIQKLEGADPYEASTRVSTLMTQIETSYALTARIQQLSLAKYLS